MSELILNKTVKNTPSKPWYLHPMVWLVIGIPLSSVVAGIGFIYLAITNPNDVVKDNYYKEGLAINLTLAQDQRARDLGLTGLVTIDASNERLRVKLSSTNQPFIRFGLYHVNDSDLDLNGAMAKSANVDNRAEYVYQLDTMVQGRWYLEIKGDDGSAQNSWRLRARLDLPVSGPITLSPPLL
jgi:hypothetical protein